MATIGEVYKVHDQSFSVYLLNKEEVSKIEVLEIALTAEGKDEQSRALIQAKKEHDRYQSSIPNLAKTAESNRIELEQLKERATILQKEIAGQNSILDIQKDVAELVTNLSTPLALVVFALGAGPIAIAAAPVVTRCLGTTASNVIDAAKGEQTPDKPEETSPEQKKEAFAFSNINQEWYKAIRTLITQKKDSKMLLSRLIVSINNNDSMEHDLKILSEVFSKALEKGKKQEQELKKKLDDRGWVRVVLSTVSYLASNLPTMEQVGSYAGRASEVIGRLAKRAEPDTQALPAPDPKKIKPEDTKNA